MNFYTFSAIVNLISSISLGGFVFYKGSRSKVNRHFTYLCLAIAIWSLGYILWQLSDNGEDALFWTRALMFGATFTPIFYFSLVIYFLGFDRYLFYKILLVVSYLISLFFAFSSVLTDSIVLSVSPKLQFNFWPNGGSFFIPFLAMFFGFVAFASILLITEYQKADRLKRRQIIFMLTGIVLGFIGGSTNYFLWFDLPIPPIGTILVTCYPLAIGYAILRHHLLNIKAVTAELFTGVLLIILLGELFLSQSPIEFAFRLFFLILASIFGFLLVRSVLNEVNRREELQKISEKLRQSNLLLAERNMFLSALQELTGLITRTLDFKKATQEIADGIAKKLGYIGGILMLISDDLKTLYPVAITQTPITKRAIKLLPQPPEKYSMNFKTSNTLSALAIKTGEIKIGDQMTRFISPPVPKVITSAIQKLIRAKSIAAVPIYSEDKIIGVIDYVLAKPKGEIDSNEIQMMKALADQVGIVTRNLIYYEKLQDVNRKLEKANVELKKLDQAKSEFISIASHQLRTPLTVIKGYISMILEGFYGNTARPLKNTLKKVFESTERLIRLVNELLNVSRIESGKMVFNLQPMSLGKLVSSVVLELQQAAKDKGLKLIFQKSANLPPINGDEEKLRQVVMNLIDNSIKYTPHGKIWVNIERKDDVLEFSVKDTGMGIDKRDLPRLFQKFSRGTGMSLVHTEGTGIGLFIGKKIIEAHGGKIWAESKGRDQGSRFAFTVKIVNQ